MYRICRMPEDGVWAESLCSLQRYTVNKFTYEAAPVAVQKKTKPATGVFERLLASARRLLALVTKSEGVMTNKDMAKFADQINSLCDKWEI